jgi:hypothetical protein
MRSHRFKLILRSLFLLCALLGFSGVVHAQSGDTAKFLRTRGFNIKGPEDGSISSDPEQHDQPNLSWRLLGLETGSVPAAHIPTKSTDAIFFVQVGSAHPNTAKKLVSV